MIKERLSGLYVALLACVVLFVGAPAFAADYGVDVVPTEEGEYTTSFESWGGIFRSRTGDVRVDTADGDVTLATKQDDTYRASGTVTSKNILNKQYRYFESASIDIDADIPEGTSIEFFLRTVDEEASEEPSNIVRTWTTVTEDEEVDLGSFFAVVNDPGAKNYLRWKAVLHTDDPAVTPTLHSLTITYHNATPNVQLVRLSTREFGVNPTTGATITATLTGSGFIEDREEVYIKNLLAASSVDVIDRQTLRAVFPIEQFRSAGSYTVVVRNIDTGRIGVTDGDPLPSLSAAQIAPEEYRLIMKWFEPQIIDVTQGVITYLSGGSFTIKGNYFSFGSFVDVIDNANDYDRIPEDAVQVIDEHTIIVDLSSTTITNFRMPRDETVRVMVTAPDYQTVTTANGIRID